MKKVRIAINGFGRIGRQVLKAVLERHRNTMEIVAINDLFDVETNAHLFKYDTNYGRFQGTVAEGKDQFVINGQPISEATLVALVAQVREALAQVDPAIGPYITWEVLTALAFLAFQEARVDSAVIEVGLGGRLDSTNVLKPEVTAITSISKDHMQQLGHTLPKIAEEISGKTFRIIQKPYVGWLDAVTLTFAGDGTYQNETLWPGNQKFILTGSLNQVFHLNQTIFPGPPAVELLLPFRGGVHRQRIQVAAVDDDVELLRTVKHAR